MPSKIGAYEPIVKKNGPWRWKRLSFFPEVPEHEVVAELFLPLKVRPLTAA